MRISTLIVLFLVGYACAADLHFPGQPEGTSKRTPIQQNFPGGQVPFTCAQLSGGITAEAISSGSRTDVGLQYVPVCPDGDQGLTCDAACVAQLDSLTPVGFCATPNTNQCSPEDWPIKYSVGPFVEFTAETFAASNGWTEPPFSDLLAIQPYEVSGDRLCPGRFALMREHQVRDCTNVGLIEVYEWDDTLPPLVQLEFSVPGSLPETINLDTLGRFPVRTSVGPFACENFPGLLSGEFLQITAVDDCAGTPEVTDVVWTVEGDDCSRRLTITVVDECQNTQTVSILVLLIDNTAPVFSIQDSVTTLGCLSELQAAPQGVTVTDNCTPNVAFSFTSNEQDLLNAGNACNNGATITRQWTATDGCGNVGTATSTIVFDDSEAPVPVSPPEDLSLQCTSQVPALASLSATDNCSGVLTDAGSESSNNACQFAYTLTRTWTFSDECGNGSNFQQTIDVSNAVAPTVRTAGGDFSQDIVIDLPVRTDCDNLEFPDQGVVEGVTACGEVFVTLQTPAPVKQAGNGCAGSFTLTQTWTVTDPCNGLSTTVTINMPVLDTTPPQCSVVPEASPAPVECGNALQSPEAISLQANCVNKCDANLAVVVGAPDDQFTGAGGCSALTGTVVRTWTVTESANCPINTQFVQNILIEDTLAPTLVFPSGSPSDATIECPGAFPDAKEAILIDQCEGQLAATIITDSPENGGCPVKSVLTYTYNGSDTCGNVATAVTETYTQVDTTAPTITTNPGPQIDFNCENLPFVPSLSAVQGSDTCDGDIAQATSVSNNGDVYTWTVADSCNNESQHVSTLVVFDDQDPSLTISPATRTMPCQMEQAVLMDPVVSMASDNCAAEPDIVLAGPGVGVRQDINGNCEYTISRDFTATDEFGNTATETQVITFQDNMAPSLTNFANTRSAGATCADVINVAPLSACEDDVCANGCSVTIDGDNTVCAGFRFTRTISYTATDVCGNAQSFTEVITQSENNPAPQFTAFPADQVLSAPPTDDFTNWTAASDADPITAEASCPANLSLTSSLASSETIPGITEDVRTFTACDDTIANDCVGCVAQDQNVISYDLTQSRLDAPFEATAEFPIPFWIVPARADGTPMPLSCAPGALNNPEVVAAFFTKKVTGPAPISTERVVCDSDPNTPAPECVLDVALSCANQRLEFNFVPDKVLGSGVYTVEAKKDGEHIIDSPRDILVRCTLQARDSQCNGVDCCFLVKDCFVDLLANRDSTLEESVWRWTDRLCPFEKCAYGYTYDSIANDCHKTVDGIVVRHQLYTSLSACLGDYTRAAERHCTGPLESAWLHCKLAAGLR